MIAAVIDYETTRPKTITPRSSSSAARTIFIDADEYRALLRAAGKQA